MLRLQDPLSAFSVATAGKENSAKSSQSQVGFETLLAEADRRHQPQVTENRNRDDGGRQRSTERAENRSERSSQREERRARSNEQSEAPASVQDTAYYAENEVESNHEIEIDEEQAVAYISALMQVPVETVMQWLEYLGMSPQDLADPQNVTKLLQVALDVETTAQLLTSPEFPEMFKAINEAMSEMMQTAEVQVAIVAGSVEAKAQVENLIDTEGLQIITEEGKFVVAEQNVENEFYAEEDASQNASSDSRSTTYQPVSNQQQAVVTDILPIEAPDILSEQPQVSVASMIDMTTAKAKVEAAIQQSTAPTNVNPADVIEQIMSQVRVVSEGGQFAEMRMTLRPESLGDIVLRVITQNGIVMAQFEAESQRIKEVLEASFSELRDALDEQGIKFSELSVSVREEGNERMNQFEYARQVARRRMERLTKAEEVVEEEPKQVAPRHNGVIDITA